MKVVGAIFGACMVVVLLLGLYLAFAAIGFYNTATQTENGIVAQYKQNQNNYDNYFKKLREAAQVPQMYVDDMQKMWDKVMRGRYGPNGSKAMFQWIQEHNPVVDASLYGKLQTLVEAGRNSFEADQKALIDKRREYDNYRMVFPNNVLAGFLGFPKIKLEDYDIVTSEETAEVFKSKKSQPIRLREK